MSQMVYTRTVNNAGWESVELTVIVASRWESESKTA
jgi:hypothetical protein